MRREIDAMRLRIDYMFYSVVEYWNREADPEEVSKSEDTHQWKYSALSKEKQSPRFSSGRGGKRSATERYGGRAAAPVSNAERREYSLMNMPTRKKRRVE
jgi:hypothetical protein